MWGAAWAEDFSHFLVQAAAFTSDDGFYELTKEGGGDLDWNEVYDYDWCYHTHYPIDDEFLFCPTIYEVQTFLRDKHKKQITVTSISQESWQYRITEPNQGLIDGKFGEDFETYEKALIDAIKVTLKEIINDWKNVFFLFMCWCMYTIFIHWHIYW